MRRTSFWTAAAVIALCLWSSGSPAMLYPVYARRWDLSPTAVTTVFATYPLVLMVMLVFFGGISDRIGRRSAMLAGILALAVACVTFVAAVSPGWLYAGRALQGIGTGIALSAATAALADHNPGRDAQRVGSVATLANAIGLTLGPFLAGLLLQYAPLPRQLSYLVLLALLLVTAVLVARMPADRPAPDAADRGWRPTPVGVPAGLRHTFAAAAIGVSVAFAIGALFLSLGAGLAAQILHTGNTFLVGSLLSSLSLVIGISSVALRRLPAHTAITAGSLSATLGLLFLYLTERTGSLAFFGVTAVFSGAAFGLCLMGGMRLVATTAADHHRAQVISALYLAAYAAHGVAAVAIGLVATRYGLERAVDLFVPIVALLGLFGAGYALLHGWQVRRAALPVTHM